MGNQNIHEYTKIKLIDDEEWGKIGATFTPEQVRGVVAKRTKMTRNKLNELIIEQNRLMHDFTLYKKAFKRIHPESECIFGKPIDYWKKLYDKTTFRPYVPWEP